MSVDVRLLDPLRCKRGCSPGFAQVVHEESSWSRGLTTWRLMLRCGDCGREYTKLSVSQATKRALEQHIVETKREVELMAEAIDDANLRERLDLSKLLGDE